MREYGSGGRFRIVGLQEYKRTNVEGITVKGTRDKGTCSRAWVFCYMATNGVQVYVEGVSGIDFVLRPVLCTSMHASP